MAASAVPETRKMTSRCSPETDRCTHVFEIYPYTLQAERLGVGAALQSATFAVGGHEWRVSYYPDGHVPSASGYASVFLDFMGNQTCPVGTKVRGFVSLDVLSPITGEPMYVNPGGGRLYINHTVLNPNASNAWGCGKFIKTGWMHRYLSGDRLAIECYLSVVVGNRVSLSSGPPESETAAASSSKYEIQVPPPDNLGRLLLLETTNKEGVDVMFKVQGVVFYAHKIVLAARSPVFKAELYGGFREGSSNKNDEHNHHHHLVITIQDMEPGVFKALLHFIYTDSLPVPVPGAANNDDDDGCDLDDEGVVEHLLVAADRYAMDRMKLMCGSMLCKRLGVENVAATLALADPHYCCKLKDACISFICSSRKRIKDVMGTQGYEHLKKARPSIVINLLEESVKKSSLC